LPLFTQMNYSRLFLPANGVLPLLLPIVCGPHSRKKHRAICIVLCADSFLCLSSSLSYSSDCDIDVQLNSCMPSSSRQRQRRRLRKRGPQKQTKRLIKSLDNLVSDLHINSLFLYSGHCQQLACLLGCDFNIEIGNCHSVAVRISNQKGIEKVNNQFRLTPKSSSVYCGNFSVCFDSQHPRTPIAISKLNSAVHLTNKSGRKLGYG